MTTLSKYRQWSWLLLLIPIYFFLFLKLGSTHIRLWDEAWFTVHAIEMLQNGSWLVSYFDGIPSYTASKPPLQTWLQMSSISILGISELSLRLPSAIAASITVLVLFGFMKKQLGEQPAWLAALILLTSVGFIGFHTARGAEADALLTLILLAQGLAFFQFIQTKKPIWMIYMGGLVSLAFLTKSVAGFLILPGLLAYTLIFERNLIGTIFSSWQFYVAMVLAAATVIAYLLARDALQSGYLDMVFRSNAGRYTNAVGHDHGIGYYLRNLFTERYIWWMPLAAVGIIVSFYDPNASEFFRFSSVLSISFLVVISFSRSKLEWYDMPLYPFLAINATLGVQTVLKSALPKMKIAIMILLFLFPSFHMFSRSQANELRLTEMEYEAQEMFLSQAYRSAMDLDDAIVVHDHFYGSMLFYRHMFEQKDMNLTLQNHTNDLASGDQVLVKGKAHLSEIVSVFDVDTLDKNRSAILLKLKEKIEQESI